jgi:hypothetical protein
MGWRTVGVLVIVTLSLFAAPRAVAAQPAKVPRIGMLAVEGGMVATAERFQGEFREALRGRGYIEGQTIHTDYR